MAELSFIYGQMKQAFTLYLSNNVFKDKI